VIAAKQSFADDYDDDEDDWKVMNF